MVLVDKGCVTVSVAVGPKVTAEVDNPVTVVVVEYVSFDAADWTAEVSVEVAVDVTAETVEVELADMVPDRP